MVTKKTKLKVLSGIFAAAILVAASYGVMNSVRNSNASLNDLAKANIEALANNEMGTPCGGPRNADTGCCEARNTVNCKDLCGCQ